MRFVALKSEGLRFTSQSWNLRLGDGWHFFDVPPPSSCGVERNEMPKLD